MSYMILIAWIQPGKENQLYSGSNVAQSRWMDVRGARVGPQILFQIGASERRAIR